MIAKKNIIEDLIENNELPITDLDFYGNEIAKVKSYHSKSRKGKLIVVTAMNPNPAGEGKTTSSVGLVDALNKHGIKTIGALREPSLGPVFGMKGTGSGGGKSFLRPFDKINLHFTGDLHAIAAANNLIVSVIENDLYFKSTLNIDPKKILVKRCLDLNDRSLREISYFIRDDEIKTGFNITAASDLMALFCLCYDHEDLKQRLKRTVVAFNLNGDPITIDDLEIADAVMTILHDALYPNLVRTNEDNPVFVHGGPFANIAHGCNSYIATKYALDMADVVVTECGFGSDLGLEKFMDIKCQEFDLCPDLIGMVISIRSLFHHAEEILDPVLKVKTGFNNVLRHIEHIKQYQIPYFTIINMNDTVDTKETMETLINLLEEHNIPYARSYAYGYGSERSDEIYQVVTKLLNDDKKKLKPIYDLKDTLLTKIDKVVKNVYGADGFVIEDNALKNLKNIKNYDSMYLVMAKTPYSLSDDMKLLNAPTGFKIHIQSFEVNYFSNMIIAITTTIYKMPGLNKIPAAKNFVMK
ncbi:formate--tetrahydrofolate ligase [Ureaplasma canigenitalium]|uniref:formate--tetrahydrofolate ligase n=1 Tax=Ureaplasma canigenitalium TaxID=42092 RepID=UPI0004E1CBD4|nr:formate--tetrahydrofolate ligase [Ureaplasma canigenitalium]